MRRPVTIALALLAGLVAGEAALRIRRFGLGREALGPWRAARPWEPLRSIRPDGDPAPNPGGVSAFRLGPGQPVIRYALNAAGLRDERQVEARPAPGVCRVLALGDAYTFGYGVAERDAYPARLEQRLARRGRIEVLNAGFPDLNVEQQERRLTGLLPGLAPDVVLVSFSWWNLPLPPAPPRPARWSAAWLVANLEQKGERVGMRLAAADTMLGAARAVWTPALFPPSGLAREIEPLALPPDAVAARFARAARALDAMAAAAAAAGARFAVVVTPLDVQVDAARNALYRSGALPYPAHGFTDVDYTRAEALPAALARFAAEAGIALVDTTPAFRRHRELPLFLRGDYHAAPAGHRLIAREVDRWFARARPCPDPR